MQPNTPVLSLIAAMTIEGVIGRDNTLPWRIPSDIRRFKKLTTGHPVIMGRRCWESLPRPLPERTNIVLTRQANYQADGAIMVSSVQNAYRAALRAPGADEVFVIGGEEIYRQFFPLADKAYITEVYVSLLGDAYFPFPSSWISDWQSVKETPAGMADPNDQYPTSFTILSRVAGKAG